MAKRKPCLCTLVFCYIGLIWFLFLDLIRSPAIGLLPCMPDETMASLNSKWQVAGFDRYFELARATFHFRLAKFVRPVGSCLFASLDHFQ